MVGPAGLDQRRIVLQAVVLLELGEIVDHGRGQAILGRLLAGQLEDASRRANRLAPLPAGSFFAPFGLRLPVLQLRLDGADGGHHVILHHEDSVFHPLLRDAVDLRFDLVVPKVGHARPGHVQAIGVGADEFHQPRVAGLAILETLGIVAVHLVRADGHAVGNLPAKHGKKTLCAGHVSLLGRQQKQKGQKA